MTNTSVASDFLQSLDVHCDLTTKVTLNGNGLVDCITNTSYFFIGQISDTGIRIDICLLQNFYGTCSTDTVDIS